MMLHHILEANGGLPDRAVVSFQNTGREMPETLDFVQECGERWGVRIVWLEYRPDAPRFEVVSHNSASRNGEPFAALIRNRRMIPNRVARFCTAELKVHCLSRYLRTLGWERYVRTLGIRADEQGRLRSTPPKERYSCWYPMADAGLSKADVAAFWRHQPFDLRLPNVGGKTPLGNCDACPLKSEANLAALARDYPDRAQWWADQEAALSAQIGKSGGAWFNQHRPMADVIAMVTRQGDWIFDAEGALCQADDGECVA
jgi:3'-phosphoadenosine 5'-phosphosulfate sulfotransferase (PAPS reductase)/FAD synthetase